jgi:Family of unknown function (DUF5682)
MTNLSDGPLAPARDLDPARAVDELAACRAPFLIGIRHHSPMLAAAVPRLLDSASPDLVFVELPEELQPWLQWLGAEDLVSPVALAAARRDGQGLVFYPYADFSPELAAVRWARAHGVAVQAFDLPVGLAVDDDAAGRTRLAPPTRAPLTDALRRAAGADDADELWDRLVEARSSGAAPEAIRRAALAVGWTLRVEQATWGKVPESDLQREAWMRRRLRAALEAGIQRPAAVIGAFHAAALAEAGSDERPQKRVPFADEREHRHGGETEKKTRRRKPADVVASLVPYTFAQLDSRTGYPAGIRDPEWQQGIWKGGGTPEATLQTLNRLVLRICRELRRRGQPAGVPDAREAIRLAVDLARLRGLPAPGRRELIEGLQSALAQGEPLGRGRAVAAAMQAVLVGKRRGRLGAGAPRSGLGPHVEGLLAELRLPGPNDADPLEIRLDPLRSDLDRRRHVALQRLIACGVPYAHPINVDPDLLTGRWILRWVPATAATIELSGHRGVTLAQAAEGSIRARLAQAQTRDGPTSGLRIDTLRAAAECATPRLVRERLDDLERNLPHQANLPDLVEALELCDRIRSGHVPGFQPDATLRAEIAARVMPALAAAALVAIEGLAGSDNLEDARALLALVQRVVRGDPGTTALGDSRLRWALEHLERDGSPLMQGASGAVRVLIGDLDAQAFGERLGSWVDSGSSRATTLARRIAGALAMAAPLLEAAPEVSERLIERIGALDDPAFLQRLPALREGFDVLSPAGRQRFLQALRPRLAASFDLRLDRPPALLARWADADQHGHAAIATLGEPA